MKWIYNNKEWDTSKFPKDGSAEVALRDILWYNGYFNNKDDGGDDNTLCDKLKALLKKKLNKRTLSVFQ